MDKKQKKQEFDKLQQAVKLEKEDWKAVRKAFKREIQHQRREKERMRYIENNIS